MIAKPLQLDQFHLPSNIPYEALLTNHKIDSNQFKKLNVHILSKYLKSGRTVLKGTLINVPSQKVAEMDVE